MERPEKTPDGREVRALLSSEKSESEDKRMKELEINKFGKTRKDTRWKGGESVVVELEKSESEDGCMRELIEI